MNAPSARPCGGADIVKSPQTVSYEILAEARRISKGVDHHSEAILRVNPDVAKVLRGPERDVLAEIEAYLGDLVTIKSNSIKPLPSGGYRKIPEQQAFDHQSSC